MRRTDLAYAVRLLIVVTSGALLSFATYQSGPTFNWSWIIGCSWALLMWAAVLSVWARKNRQRCSRTVWMIACLTLLLLCYLFSRTAASPDFFLLNWAPTKPWVFGKSWLERTLAISVIFLVIGCLKKKCLGIALLLCLVGCQIAAFTALIDATGGDPLYRIDHPSFLYRLWSYAQTMPRFIYYDPFWNGGSVMPYLVASGVMAPGLFLWPVWKFVPITVAYTPAFGFLFIVIVPLLAALSCRMITRNRLACVAAAVLGLGTSHFYFVHLVNYGTFGSLLCAAFLMPISASLYRLVMLGKRDRLTVIVLGLSGAVALCWPPVVITALPLSVAVALNWKRLNRRTIVGVLVCACLLTLLFCLPALSLCVHSRVHKITSTSMSPFSLTFLSAGFQQLGVLLRQSHPVILFAGLLAPLVLPLRRVRRWFFPLLLCSLLVAAWGKGWKRDLQLDRVWVNALFIGVLPTALVLGWLSAKRAWVARAAVSLLCGLLVMGGYNTVKYMGNKGRARYNTMTPQLHELVAWLKKSVPPDGRILFAGAAVHGYSGGKVASLPIYTGREMMSCDYFGFSPKLVEYNYPPQEFRKHGPEKLFQFMDLYNVTHVITYHEDWKTALRRHDSQYEEMISFGKKTIFRVRRDSGMFAAGEGRVEAGINCIVVSPADKNESVVIKYNWVEGLTCTPRGATLEPWNTGTSVRLIKVNPNGADAVSIAYKRWF
jgi:hypothetical protein